MKLLYPCKIMNITQSYLGDYSHKPNRIGVPCDYPIDEAGSDTGRDYFYAPCDLKISKLYGVGTSGTNTIWLESIDEVEMPCGKSQITIMVVHPEDDDLKAYKVDQIFRQGDKMFREGKDGNATGNHFHMAIAKGKIRGTGWVKNSESAWVINTTGDAIKTDEAFYLSDNTIIKSTCGLNFKEVDEVTQDDFDAKMKVYLENQAKEKPSDWSGDARKWAEANNVITGGTNGEMQYKSPVTREQLVIFLKRITSLIDSGKMG